MTDPQAIRAAALREAAELAYNHLFPKTTKSVWTDQEMHMAKTASDARNSILALIDQAPEPVPQGVTDGLQPCPFCGGDPAEPWFNDDDDGGGGWGEVYCSSCTASIRSEYISWLHDEKRDDAVSNAISAWNRRALTTAPVSTAEEEKE